VANIKSQIKRNKQNVVDRERNKKVKSEVRTRVKNAVAAVGTEDEESALRLPSSASTRPPPRRSSTRTRPPIRRAG